MTKVSIIAKPKIFDGGPLEKSAAYKRVFLAEEGRRVLEDITVAMGWYKSSHGDTPEDTEYMAGKRDAVAYIRNLLVTELEVIDL